MLVVEAKILTYEEFMDNIMGYEIETLLDMLKYVNRHEWQQTRLMIYTFMAPYMKKGFKKDLEDILPLPFDKKFTKKKQDPLTEKQKEKMDIIAANIADMIKNNKISFDGK